MRWTWLKQIMPRGLYGRAALILVVPIITLQLVVSVGFLQRHFEDVTGQLTRALAFDVNLILAEFESGGQAAAETMAARLDIETLPPDPAYAPNHIERRFYDLTGRIVVRTLRADAPEVTWIDLAQNDRRVRLGIALSQNDAMTLDFERRRVSPSNPHQLLVLMIFTGILMTAVAYLFLRNQLRPIRRLARAAEAFGRGQTVDYRPRGAIEVRAAGNAFLEMRARIERYIDQRTMMLSGVSHDLRTPLTRMRLSLSLLEDDSDEIAGLLRDVEEMDMLLTTFLDFSRSEALDDPEPTDITALTTQMVEDMTRHGADVTLCLPDAPLPLIALRPQAIRRALANLLSNALRYGTRAQLSVEALDRSLRLSVEDDGPGIAPQDRAAAIRPFTRLDAARNQNQGGGVGLGLAIANDIARSHGGTMRLDRSQALGGLRVDLVLAR